VVVVSPQGFLLAKRSEQHVQQADELTATRALDPKWVCPAQKEIGRELYVKPELSPPGARALTFEFGFSVLDAHRRKLIATATTNSINWNASG
jgi:hypothetical protein